MTCALGTEVKVLKPQSKHAFGEEDSPFSFPIWWSSSQDRKTSFLSNETQDSVKTSCIVSWAQTQLCPHVKSQKKREKGSFTHFPLLNTEKLTLWDPGGEKSNMLYDRRVEGSIRVHPTKPCPSVLDWILLLLTLSLQQYNCADFSRLYVWKLNQISA